MKGCMSRLQHLKNVAQQVFDIEKKANQFTIA